MKRKHVFHRENCDSRVRVMIEDKLGNKVSLLGKHAFEWSIVMEKEGKVIITSFHNRKEAVKEFNKYLIK